MAIAPADIAERASPPVTAVDLPAGEMGERAVELLMAAPRRPSRRARPHAASPLTSSCAAQPRARRRWPRRSERSASPSAHAPNDRLIRGPPARAAAWRAGGGAPPIPA